MEYVCPQSTEVFGDTHCVGIPTCVFKHLIYFSEFVNEIWKYANLSDVPIVAIPIYDCRR